MNLDTRKYVIIVIIVFTGILYSSKLFYMQVIDDKWKSRAGQIAEKRREIKPPRAIVLDRNGTKIVTNKIYYNLNFVEDDITDLDTVAFAKLIGWTVDSVKLRFLDIVKETGVDWNPSLNKNVSRYRSDRSYTFLKELTSEEIGKIAPRLDEFPGFFEETISMRNYPFAVASNIFGYLNEVNQKEIDKDKFYQRGDLIGRTGIESFYEKQFRGEKGVKYVVTSARGLGIAQFEDGKFDTTAVQAKPIHLGLDVQLQEYGEKLLKNKKGCIVAIEPETGEILALISSPNFDPNSLVGAQNIRENYTKLVNDPNKPLFPRPLASMYMPGSTFKLVQSLIGMQEGVITENSGFACNKSVVGCHAHPNAQSVSQAVKMSCNPYFYAVTRRIIHQDKKPTLEADAEVGLDRWAKYMHSFGLGIKLETDITGLTSGVIPTAKYYDKWYGHHQWKFSTIRSISIGQGEVQLTPLQLANMAAIMANRGWYITPHFVASIGNDGPLKKYRIKNRTMVDPKYFSPVIEGMRQVVEEAGGTASRARIDGITICGKTGTVENYIGSVKQKNHSVFIAFAPMEKPKIAISVFIENAGGGGGTWAAPMASLMIEKYLNGEIKNEARERRLLDAQLSIMYETE